jgi:hypothetical protein
VGLGRHAIYESAPGASLDQVRGMISRAIVRHKIKRVVLDYWQLVGGKAKGEFRRISFAKRGPMAGGHMPEAWPIPVASY